MSNQSLSLSLVLKQGGTNAARALVDGLAKGGDHALAVRRAIRDNPEFALAVIASPKSETGLTLVGRGRLLDETIGTFADEDAARQLVEDHVLPSVRVEILKAHGDLPMAAADVLSLDDVLAAILGDMRETQEALALDGETGVAGRAMAELMERLHILRTWAYKLKDRKDYAELLAAPVGEYTVNDLLLLAIAVDHDVFGDGEKEGLAPEEGEGPEDGTIASILDSAFAEFGLDPDESRERLVELMEDGPLENVDADLIAEVAETMAKQRRVVETASSIDTGADKVADAGDL